MLWMYVASVMLVSHTTYSIDVKKLPQMDDWPNTKMNMMPAENTVRSMSSRTGTSLTGARNFSHRTNATISAMPEMIMPMMRGECHCSAW